MEKIHKAHMEAALLPRHRGWKKLIKSFEEGMESHGCNPQTISEFVNGHRRELKLPSGYSYPKKSHLYAYLSGDRTPDLHFIRVSHAAGLFPGKSLQEVEAIACGQSRRRSPGKCRAA